MFKKSQWIWTDECERPDSWVRFRVEADVKTRGSTAVFRIGVETKYYLYINGNLVVFDGGLYRESSPGHGYYDEIDISVQLRSGKNELILDCWFYGNGGRNNTRLPQAGVIFECAELEIYSTNGVMCGRLNAFYAPEGEQPAYLYGGYNIGFDASRDSVSYRPAVEYASYGAPPYKRLQKRPIPLFRFSDNKTAAYRQSGRVYTVDLPYAMHCSPYLKVKSTSGKLIGIRSDRYEVNGGPGDSRHIYRGHRYEYTTKDGVQEYSAYNWIFAEKLYFTMDDDIEVLALGYRESGYDTNIKVCQTKDPLLNRLLEKCVRTLKVCLRENFMDCPDRERGQWIGDVSVQAPQVFAALDANAVSLLKKAIQDFFVLREGDVLVGNVPGENFCELPSQSLNAISEIGMLAYYYRHTQDSEILRLAYEPSVRYLKLWRIESDGFISKRTGNWYWFDHNHNIDAKILENCWYYSALKFAVFMAEELGIVSDRPFLEERIQSIGRNFHQAFWKSEYYASGEVVDDRANAMAVLVGLADENCRAAIHNVLVTVFNSSIYMEGYVLDALCRLGYKEDAFKRMMSRYYPLIINENSTLWEDFYILGTKNHAWAGSPLTVINEHFKEWIID
jgi:hypothetical protein